MRIPTGAPKGMESGYVPILYRVIEFAHELVLDTRERRYKKKLAQERRKGWLAQLDGQEGSDDLF